MVQDDDHDAEEWERYEALHEDVDKQVFFHTSLKVDSVLSVIIMTYKINVMYFKLYFWPSCCVHVFLIAGAY